MPINNKNLERIINMHNSGPCHLELNPFNSHTQLRLCLPSFLSHVGTNQTSMPYHNSVHSEQYCAWTIDPLSVHSIINLCWVITCLQLYWTSWLERLLCLWLNRIDTKPVTCSKGPKVPFVVTHHLYNNIACKQAFLVMFSHHQDINLVKFVPKVIWGHYKHLTNFNMLHIC